MKSAISYLLVTSVFLGCSTQSSEEVCDELLARFAECGARVPAEATCTPEMIDASDALLGASCEDLAGGTGKADGWGDLLGPFFRNWDAWFDRDPGAEEDASILCGNSACVAHDPIRISNNSDFLTSQSGVVRGSGTADDPYVISGWRINSGNGAHEGLQAGIQLTGTTAHVLIEENDLRAGDVGITVEYAQNVVVRENIVRWNIGDIALSVEGELSEDGMPGTGVAFVGSSEISVEKNQIRDIMGGHGSASMYGGTPGSGGNGIGLSVDGCSAVRITDNDIFRIDGNWGGGVGPSGSPLAPGGLGAPGGDGFGIVLRWSSDVRLEDNRIYEVDGRAGGPGGASVFSVAGNGGNGGEATGVYAEDCADLVLADNSVRDVAGGFGAAGGGTMTFGGNGGNGGDTFGFHFACPGERSCAAIEVTGNRIEDIDGWTGGGGFIGSFPGIGGKGGAAFGVLVEDAHGITVGNDNDIYAVDSGSGGPGLTWLFHWGESGVEAEVCYGTRREQAHWGDQMWTCG